MLPSGAIAVGVGMRYWFHDEHLPSAAGAAIRSPPLIAWTLVLCWLLAATPATARVGAVTGLPLPRFVSLRANEVNFRTGPGVRYPIEWVFMRAGLPVQVIAEFDTWRKIRDPDGTEGWVHQSMLSGRRHVIVVNQVRSLRKAPEPAAPPIARLEPGVILRLKPAARPGARWSRGRRGWLPRPMSGLAAGAKRLTALIWIARLSTAKAASLTASFRVGGHDRCARYPPMTRRKPSPSRIHGSGCRPPGRRYGRPKPRPSPGRRGF